jgi:hypothetical protein
MIIGVTQSNLVSTFGLVDIRIGALLALTAYGITVLARLPDQSTLRETLADIRRELVLRETSVEEAFHRTRVALQGMWLSDIVREDTRILIGFISSVRGEYEDAFRRIRSLRETSTIDAKKVPVSDDIVTLALADALDILKGHESRVNAIANEYHELFYKVRKRLLFATHVFRGASNDFNRLVDEIQRAQAPVDQLQQQYVSAYCELQDVWNAWFPDKKRDHKPFGPLSS